MNKNLFETLVGALVLVIAGYFTYYVYGATSVVGALEKGFPVKAVFDNADGVNMGTDVKMSGIKIGKVSSLKLDDKTFRAVIEMNLRPDIKLPTDSSAEISGNGLLGERYVSIQPGADTEYLARGGNIEFTQSSISLEKMIGKFMFGVDGKPQSNEKKQ